MISAIVVAGGSGERFGGDRPKQLMPLCGKPILSHCLEVFEKSPLIDEIILVAAPDWLNVIELDAVKSFDFKKVRIVPGGQSRTQSAKLGFKASKGDLIFIHDGVRPLLDQSLLEKLTAAARLHGAAIAAIPARDTLKVVSDAFVVKTLDRSSIWQVQTPQVFQRDVLARAYAKNQEATDDAALVEILGETVAVVESSASNIKITTKDDLTMAKSFLQASAFPSIRIGQGYDTHRFASDRPLWLACVEVPYEKGLLGHSDADVMAHALVDALLGAAGLGDIGLHFPDNDSRWLGASGKLLLTEAMLKVRGLGYELLNCDLTLIGEKPKISPYREQMRKNIALSLSVKPEQVNIKASTTEGLDAVGRGDGLTATAIALLNLSM